MPHLRLDADALSLVRGGRPIFSDLSFSLAPGEAMLLRGPNGAGKSSALMVLASMLAPQSGTVCFHGQDPEARPLAFIHSVGHDPAIKSGLSVAENLAFWTDVLGGPRDGIAGALAACGLERLSRLDAGLLSAGQTRRLALARLLAVPRPLWLLDEPTSALDAQGSKWVEDLISDHIGAGGMAVVATHLDIDVRGRVKTLSLGAASA